MQDEIRKLRVELARLPRGGKRRFPPRVRKEIAQLGSEMRGQGASWRDIGKAIGIATESVRRLCEKKTPAFAPVEVVDAESRAVLVSPSGYRIEGLTIAALAELLGRLR